MSEDSMLNVSYKSMEDAALKCEEMAGIYHSQLEDLEQQIRAIVFQGETGPAIVARFESIKTQIEPVREMLTGLGGQIRETKEALIATDQNLAGGYQG